MAGVGRWIRTPYRSPGSEEDEDWRGRGPVAVEDMKARLADMRRRGIDPIPVLWERHVRAIYGNGYTYEFAGDQR